LAEKKSAPSTAPLFGIIVLWDIRIGVPSRIETFAVFLSYLQKVFLYRQLESLLLKLYYIAHIIRSAAIGGILVTTH